MSNSKSGRFVVGWVVKYAAPAPMRGTVTRGHAGTDKPWPLNHRRFAERVARRVGGRVYPVSVSEADYVPPVLRADAAVSH